MKTALVGHTGFVGSSLLRQTPFSHLYHSRNATDIENESFDFLVCAGARAEKWKANQDPATDSLQIQSLIRNLEKVKAAEAVLISTVDVFPKPVEVDEASAIDTTAQHPYGKHRYELEVFFRSHFPRNLIVRLPGLFGMGLKKNAIYDLMHGNQLEKIHPQSKFQFYDLENLWTDLQVARANGLKLVHFAVEPTSMKTVAHEGLGVDLQSTPSTPPVTYDFRSRFSALWGENEGYLYSKEKVIERLRLFRNRQLGSAK